MLTASLEFRDTNEDFNQPYVPYVVLEMGKFEVHVWEVESYLWNDGDTGCTSGQDFADYYASCKLGEILRGDNVRQAFQIQKMIGND